MRNYFLAPSSRRGDTKAFLDSLFSLESMSLLRFHSRLIRVFSTAKSLSSSTDPSPILPPITTISTTGDSLHRRIWRLGGAAVSITPVLEGWIKEGRAVEVSELEALIKQLRNRKRFKHALQVSQWMTDQCCSELSLSMVAVRLELIYKVQGLEQAKKFFNNIPKQLKGMEAFGTLLYCYVHMMSVENAEDLFKKMKELGYANSLSYNTLMNLYLQMKQYEKLDGVIKEMNGNGISCNKFTYGMLMSKSVATSDIDQMEATLKRLEDDPKVIAAWEVYSIAADGYKKVGLLDKAVKMLKRSEAVVPLKQQRVACDLLLSRYSGMGLKDDVYRLWNLQKSISKKVSNASYICMLSSLSNLDDIEGAEKVFEEWESMCFCYDFRVPNQLVAAYCKKEQFDKAESFINKAIEGGRTPYPSTWEYLATGYINSNQIPKGLEMMKKAMSLKKYGWKPRSDNVAACLAYLSRKGDVEGAEEFSRLSKLFH